ncbi:hypothetical protein ACQKWADRAFT_221755 [Trichoderma austrokoningii]
MSPEAGLDDSAVNAASPSISSSPEPADHASSNGRPSDKSKKRASADDGSEPPHKVTKRRAARACVSCRARKVRCDVVEGAPCGNCRWDNVECIVQESRRRKKNLVTPSIVGQGQSAEAQLRSKAPPPNPIAINSADLRRTSGGSSLSPASMDPSGGLLPNTGIEGHVPHMICKPCSLLFRFFGVLSNFSALIPDPPGSGIVTGQCVLGGVNTAIFTCKIKRLACATRLNWTSSILSRINPC